MLNLYCQKCGGATSFTISKPKFCSHCAHPFGSIAQASTAAPAKPVAPSVETKEEVKLPDIKNIQIDFRPTTPGRVKFGDVYGADAGSTPFTRPKQKTSKKKILEELRRESRPIKPGESIQIGAKE